MNTMELREFSENQVNKSYQIALEKLLLEFVETENKALQLLADAMLIYSTCAREDIEKYLEAMKKYEEEMKRFEDIRSRIRLLREYENELKRNLQGCFSSVSYSYTISDYYEQLPAVRQKHLKLNKLAP